MDLEEFYLMEKGGFLFENNNSEKVCHKAFDKFINSSEEEIISKKIDCCQKGGEKNLLFSLIFKIF